MDTQEKREKEEQGKSPSPLCTSAAGKEDLSVPVGLADGMYRGDRFHAGGLHKDGLVLFRKFAKMMKKAEKQLGFKLLEHSWRKRRRRLKALRKKEGSSEKIPGAGTPCAGGC